MQRTFFVYIYLSIVLCSCEKPVLSLTMAGKLVGIQVSCGQNHFPKLVNFPCEAIGTYSDGSAKRVTYEADWSVSDSSILAPAQSQFPGWMVGSTPGVASVNAAMRGIQGSFQITITPATPVSLAVAPPNQIFRSGSRQKFTAICVFSDNTFFDVTNSSTWSSQDTSVASVTNNFIDGTVVTAETAGTTNIIASFGGVQGLTGVTILDKVLIALQINSNSGTVIQGQTLNFTATGVNNDFTTVDLTNDVIWSVVDTTIGSISNATGTNGRFTGVLAGTTSVLATFGSLSNSLGITVINPTLTSITVSPVNPTIAVGSSQQLTATAHYSNGTTIDVSENAVWLTSDATIASPSNVSGSKGLVTTTLGGTVDIFATFGGVSGQTTLTVSGTILNSITLSPGNPMVPLGANQNIIATAHYSDGSTVDVTTGASWTSSDVTVATVNNAGSKGRVAALNNGIATISATYNGVVGQTLIVVTAAQLVSIQISPTNQTIAKGLTVQFVATGTYSDGSTLDVSSLVTWASVNNSISTVSNSGGSHGLATGAGVGSTTILASLSGVLDQTTINVTSPLLLSIDVTPANSTVAVLVNIQFTATGNYTDGSTVDLTNVVTWASSNTVTATISNAAGTKGRATGAGLGGTTISATHPGGVVGSTQLSGTL